jgi:hypothetical protein
MSPVIQLLAVLALLVKDLQVELEYSTTLLIMVLAEVVALVWLEQTAHLLAVAELEATVSLQVLLEQQ